MLRKRPMTTAADSPVRNIAGDDPELASRKHEQVVPVAAHVATLGGDVAGGHLESGTRGRAHGSRLRSSSRPRPARLPEVGSRLRRPPVRRPAAAIRRRVGKRSFAQSSDVQDADQTVANEQRDAQHGPDALLPQDGVGHRGLVDPVQSDGPSFGRDPAGEASPQRNANVLIDLFFEAACGSRPSSCVRVRAAGRPRCPPGAYRGPGPGAPPATLRRRVGSARVGERLDAPQMILVVGPSTLTRDAGLSGDDRGSSEGSTRNNSSKPVISNTLRTFGRNPTRRSSPSAETRW